MREMLVPVFKNGTCIYPSYTVMELQEICTKEKNTIWDENKRFVNPSKTYVDLSDKLYQMKQDLLHEMSAV